MSERKIYKFRDTVDFESAFIVSDTFLDAENKMKELTSLEFVHCDTRDADDFPDANKRSTGTYVWVNRILPF